MEIFKGAVAASTATGPLHDNGNVWICCRNVDDLANPVDRTGLECDVVNSNRLGNTYGFGRLLSRRDASCYTEPFNWEALAPKAAM